MIALDQIAFFAAIFLAMISTSESFTRNSMPANYQNRHTATVVHNEEHHDLIQKVELDGIDSKFDISFTLLGEPIPLKRHRIARGIMFNPSSKEQKTFLKSSEEFIPHEPLEGPLEARMIFYFSRPKYHYGTGRNANVKKKGAPIWHSKKIDLDNLIKFVLDS